MVHWTRDSFDSLSPFLRLPRHADFLRRHEREKSRAVYIRPAITSFRIASECVCVCVCFFFL